MTNENTGHGHVYPRPDGMKARCGGPALCSTCAADAARKAVWDRVKRYKWVEYNPGHEVHPQGEWVRYEDCEVLRGNLTLAEDGLAAAMQEIAGLRNQLRVMAALGDRKEAERTLAAPEPLAAPLCDAEVRVIYEFGEPTGVRDTGGYLCHFNRVTKWQGQEDRYRNELALRARQAEAIATALRSALKSEGSLRGPLR
jgi:hypothetical protein